MRVTANQGVRGVHCGSSLDRERRSHRPRIEEATVASVCDVCGKGPGFGMSVSHSHRRTHRRWNPNVQRVRAIVAPGTRRRITVCTSCLKAGKVVRG
jgi:large subunit ribosomal protein L28